jgi:hypothetical protein
LPRKTPENIEEMGGDSHPKEAGGASHGKSIAPKHYRDWEFPSESAQRVRKQKISVLFDHKVRDFRGQKQ